MKPIQRAIVFLQQAREIIEQEAYHVDPFDPSPVQKESTLRDDLNEVADDLGNTLYKMEQLAP